VDETRPLEGESGIHYQATLTAIRRKVSGASARLGRSDSGEMSSAVRHGAVSVTRCVRCIRSAGARRAVETDECRREAATPRSSPQVFFMLATGARIGEALAVVWSDVDLDAGTVELSSTLIRMKGGVVAKADQDAQR